MKALKYFVGISVLITVSIAPSYTNDSHTEESLISDSDFLKRSENLMVSIDEFYKTLSKQFPRADVEERDQHDVTSRVEAEQLPIPIMDIEASYQLDVTSESAPGVLALALLVGGEAPKAHSLFKQFYDPYPHSMPETEEEADLRADIIIGIQEQWPIFIEAIKIKEAVKKVPNDGIKRSPFCIDGMIRVRPSWANFDPSFFQSEQQASVEHADNVDQSFYQPKKRAFVKRREAWEKHEPMWKRANSSKDGFMSRLRRAFW